MTDNSNTTQTTDTSTTATTPQPVNLNVADIVNGTILLKVAIERSAFKAEEIAEVGNVYSKLSAFVQYVQAMARAESQAAASEATKTAEEPTVEASTHETKKTKKSKK